MDTSFVDDTSVVDDTISSTLLETIPSEWYSLYRVRRNQIRMIRDRGFQLTEADELELEALQVPMSLNSLSYHVMQSYAIRAERMQTSLRSVLTKVYHQRLPSASSAAAAASSDLSHAASTSDRQDPAAQSSSSIMVYYADLPQKTKSLGVDSLKRIFEIFDASGAMQLIIISEVDFGTQAHSNLSALRLQHCWFFLDKQLLYNVTDHVLYSKHTVAKPSELGTVRLNQLPHLKASDVVSRYFGFHKGQVIKIESFLPIPGLVVFKSITYRIVI